MCSHRFTVTHEYVNFRYAYLTINNYAEITAKSCSSWEGDNGGE